MSSTPLVSVLMPVYNHERFIVQAIESALAQAQDYPVERLDIVLVDDGSTDDTPRLIEPYAGRIRAIRKPNGGALSTVNRLLEEARGELICFLAGDDFWRPGKIARQARLMAERPWVTLSYGDSAVIDAEGHVQHESYYELHGLPRAIGDVRGPLLEMNFVCAPTAMLRASLRERFWPIGAPAAWEDWWMWFHAACAGEALYLDGSDVCYRSHGANMSVGLDPVAQQRFIARELPFRRWLLIEADHPQIPFRDVLEAWRAFEWHVNSCVAAGIGSLRELVPVTASEHSACAAVLAEPVQHAAQQVRSLVRALALDFSCAQARPALALAASSAERAAPPVRTGAPIIAALASELVHEPALLHAYGEAFAAEDGILLLVDARGWEEARIAEELVALAREAGIDDGGPDVLVLSDGRPWPRENLLAVLTRDSGTATAFGARRAEDPSSLRATVPLLSRC